MTSTNKKMRLPLAKIFFVGAILEVMAAGVCNAESLTMFQRNYVGIESVTNHPIIHTSENYSTGKASLSLSYKHLLDETWLMDLNVHLKNLVRRDTDAPVRFAALSHTAYYIVRLYADTYLLAGPKFSYLYPIKALQFPAKRDADYETNVEAAAALAFYYFIHEDWILSLRIDRWRGTATNEFHGYEFGGGISYSIF
jgi:hypothetical protein